jgi:hypothetical protein
MKSFFNLIIVITTLLFTNTFATKEEARVKRESDFENV